MTDAVSIKLGEGIARVLGVLALREMLAVDGFTAAFRKQFRPGATFGTWTVILKKFVDDAYVPRLPDLVGLTDPDGVRALLATIKEVRNDSHHSHGVRMSHELERDVEKLEPDVVSAIAAVSWLCQQLLGLGGTLRIPGRVVLPDRRPDAAWQPPSWEPFSRLSPAPLKPNRIYVPGVNGNPVDLWPLAAVSLCPRCGTRELFLLNQCNDDTLILRSLEEHQLEIHYP